MRRIDVPVLIVGAGGTGLSASNFLADLGVESLLIERHASTAHLPKAHYINQRSMEIYRQHGLADAIYAKAAPRENISKIHWRTSLGGDGPLDGKIFYSPDIMGGAGLKQQYDLKGVTPPTHLPQIRLEPILRQFAEARNPGRVLFRHEFVSLSQDDRGVEAVLRNLETEEDILVRCAYVMACDGGRAVGPGLGVQMVGATDLADFVMVHIAADFSQYIHDDDAAMHMILHPHQVSGSSANQHTGGLLAFGPDHWGRHSEEWGVAWAFRPDDPERFNDATIVPRIQAFLKVDVPIEVLRVSHWTLEVILADKFRVGRAFICGDAAHKHTPGGGLGLNSGIQDAHNLCWKLALVLKGRAPESLLESYEVERRPVVSRNAEWSIFAQFNHRVLAASLGLITGAPADYNEGQIAKLLADTLDGASRRARVAEVFRTSRVEYAVHDFEMGFHYPVGAVVDDASAPPKRDPMGSTYIPTSRPGCRLPHAWLNRQGNTVSTHDLVPLGGFLLLTGTAGSAWIPAARRLAAETGIRLHAHAVGTASGPADPSGRWAAVSDIEADGAILVRPDGHVGFRARCGADDPYNTLRAALADILSARSATP